MFASKVVRRGRESFPDRQAPNWRQEGIPEAGGGVFTAGGENIFWGVRQAFNRGMSMGLGPSRAPLEPPNINNYENIIDYFSINAVIRNVLTVRVRRLGFVRALFE